MLGRVLVGLLVILAVVYLSDWAIWRARVEMGSGMGSVQVGVMIATPLKGEKEEYDWGGRASG